jgi:hypothetical protein
MTSAAFSSLAPAAFAEKPAPLDKEFLDYLAACEGKDDNWTVIADGKERRKAAEKSPPQRTPAAPADEAAAKPEVKP